MAGPKKAPVPFKDARDRARHVLEVMEYQVQSPDDEFKRSVSLVAQHAEVTRWVYISVRQAGGIWRARRTLEGVAKKHQQAKGGDVWFEIWSLHAPHEPSRRDAGGSGCPYGLGDASIPHFLVRRFKRSRTARAWEPVELWRMPE